jgi:hypothetical protein
MVLKMARKYTPKFQFVIHSGNVFIGPVKNGRATLVDNQEDAECYDDRDNDVMKCRFFKAMFGMDFAKQVIA